MAALRITGRAVGWLWPPNSNFYVAHPNGGLSERVFQPRRVEFEVVFPIDKKMAGHPRASPGLANAPGQLGSGTMAV